MTAEDREAAVKEYDKALSEWAAVAALRRAAWANKSRPEVLTTLDWLETEAYEVFKLAAQRAKVQLQAGMQ